MTASYRIQWKICFKGLNHFALDFDWPAAENALQREADFSTCQKMQKLTGGKSISTDIPEGIGVILHMTHLNFLGKITST
jgi:hypothetical protein